MFFGASHSNLAVQLIRNAPSWKVFDARNLEEPEFALQFGSSRFSCECTFFVPLKNKNISTDMIAVFEFEFEGPTR